MSIFLNEKYASLEAYVPGEQPQDKTYIKLNTNESPYPPSDGVIKAVCASEGGKLRLYPDPDCKKLSETFACAYGIEGKNVVFGNGSDEILSFLFAAFLSKNGVSFPDISYGFYKVFAELYGVSYKEIPLRRDFSVSADDYANIRSGVVIANPNAPTGLFMPLKDIEKIAASNPDNIVVIDEAYIDFGGESAIALTKKYKNLIVTGTFSKSRSMAGARLGFAVGDADVIADLQKIRFSTNPYNINRITLLAGEKAIEDSDYYKARCKDIIKDREYLTDELLKREFNVLPSMANFVFAQNNNICGKDIYSRLKEHGVLVRWFDKDRIRNFVRITIGTHDECKQLLSAIDKILKEVF